MIAETDYLIIGAGAVGFTFADTLFDETDADILLVDRRQKVGGHWVDAYPFVRLHQPSSYYGVNSHPLGSGRIDTVGWNSGFEELATQTEILEHFEQALTTRLLPSGRVRFLGGHEVTPEGEIRCLETGTRYDVEIRKRIVDASFYENAIPKTHQRSFEVGEGVRCVPPNDLPSLVPGHEDFVVLGAGKTAMDACVWLLEHGVDTQRLVWVVPRDGWMINRATTQCQDTYFHSTVEALAAQMEATAAANSAEDFADRMEAAGVWLRLDPNHRPAFFHGATISEHELKMLRGIAQIVRLGRVQAISRGRMELAAGAYDVPEEAIFVDCTASAARRQPRQPIFQQDRIVMQPVRFPWICMSAALIAWVEAHVETDKEKNALARPVAMTETVEDYLLEQYIGTMNQMAWAQHPGLKAWLKSSRFDVYAQQMSRAPKQDAAKQALIGRFRASLMPAGANLQTLLAARLSQPAEMM